MASTSSVSGGSFATGIDVPTIVSGLMDVERQPLDKLSAQYDQKTLVISTLSVFKSKVSALEMASRAMERSALFSAKTVTSTDAARVSGSANSAASNAVASVKVAQSAAASVLSMSVSSDSQSLTVEDFSLSLGATTFDSKGAEFDTGAVNFSAGDVITFSLNGLDDQQVTVGDDTDPAAVAQQIQDALDAGDLQGFGVEFDADSGLLSLFTGNPLRGIQASVSSGAIATAVDFAESLTADEFSVYLDDLSDTFASNLVELGDGAFAISVVSTETGASNALSISGVLDQASSTALAVDTLVTARNAVLQVNGLVVTRPNNTVDDVLGGVTISINEDLDGGIDVDDPGFSLGAVDFSGVDSEQLSVSTTQSDLAATAVRDFATAFNDLVDFYKTQTISSADVAARGVLNGDSAVRSLMNQLRSLYSRGLRLSDGSTMSFGSIGVDLQRDGTVLVDEGALSSAVSNGLQDKLAAGVTLGYESETSSLSKFLTSSLRTGGLVSQHIVDVTDSQSRITTKKNQLEERLTRVEERYYRQYAALDALLFRLQTTSNALSSALSALTANQGN
jgi:flagellar hook-associated protein 2